MDGARLRDRMFKSLLKKEWIGIRKGIYFAFIASFLFTALTAKAQIKAKLSAEADAVHLELTGSEKWEYQAEKKSGALVQLDLPQMDAKVIDELLNWKSPLIKKIKVEKSDKANTTTLLFTLSNDQVEFFDYLTDSPSRLIIDFYIDEEKQKQSKKIRPKPTQQAKSLSLSNKKDRSDFTKVNRVDRTPAGSETLGVDEKTLQKELVVGGEIDLNLQSGVFDSGDPFYERFRIKDYEIKEEAIIASRRNIYIRFPILRVTSSQLGQLMENPPEYVINPKETEENKQARFLQVLFEKRRDSVFFKTYELFKEKFPDSIYSEIVDYMAADIHYSRHRKEADSFHKNRAIKIYSKLVKDYPNSPLTERTRLLLLYQSLEEGDGLTAYQGLDQFLKDYPKTSEADNIRFAMAESLFLVGKYEQAFDIYEDIEKQSRLAISGVEAQYRKGDTFFEQKDFKKAIEYYSKAVDANRKFESKYPNAQFNMAESHFWLGNYKNALSWYINYLALFPKHEHNPYALTRIGEVLEILGADYKKVRGAFLESYFRYQKSPGAQIARVRMLSRQMGQMNEKELRKTTSEYQKILKTSPLPKIKEFVTLMETNGYRLRKDFDKALSLLVDYYQKNPTSANLSFFSKQIVGNISDSINEKIKQRDFVNTLKIFGRYSNTWLRNQDRIDLDYFLGKAYELSGVYSEAEKIYSTVLNRLNKLNGTHEMLERKVNEHLPSIDSMNLRLASVNLDIREYGEAFNHLEKIGNKSKLSDAEQIERVRISAKVFEEKKQISKAITYLQQLIKEWEGKEELLAPAHLKLAELYMKSKNYVQAEMSSQEALDLVDAKDKDENNSQTKIISDAIKLKADAILAQGRQLAAVEVYLELLDRFENTMPLSYVRYKVGEILFGRDDIKGAEKIWSVLDEVKHPFYSGLAKEKLDYANWQDDYKKYIDRIPAMNKRK